MRCDKCGGLLIPGYEEVACINCSKRYFPPERSKKFCSFHGSCGREVWRDDKCQLHHKLRMDQINFGKALMNRVRK